MVGRWAPTELSQSLPLAAKWKVLRRCPNTKAAAEVQDATLGARAVHEATMDLWLITPTLLWAAHPPKDGEEEKSKGEPVS